MDCDNEAIIDLMLSICTISLLISETLSIDCDNEAVINLMLSINPFSDSFLLISDKLSTRFDSDTFVDL